MVDVVRHNSPYIGAGAIYQCAQMSRPMTQEEWDECQSGVTLIAHLRKHTILDDRVVPVACAVVRTVLHFVPYGEDRPRLAIETAEAWAGDPGEENRKAADNACDGAYCVGRALESSDPAASIAAFAAGAVWDSCFAYCASLAVDAYAAHAASNARFEAEVLHAAIIRRHFPSPPEAL